MRKETKGLANNNYDFKNQTSKNIFNFKSIQNVNMYITLKVS